jgi:hypothetical protein
MMITSWMSASRRVPRVLVALALSCTIALMCSLGASIAGAAGTDTGTGQATQGEGTQTKANPSATLAECLSVGAQAERAATFEGEMAAIPGTVRMEMRISVLERLPRELAFHMVTAPGLGVWRKSAPGVKTYTYLKQVTNLTAPAIYRGEVQFRWMNDKGRPIKVALLLTNRCKQSSETPAPVAEPPAGTTTETAGKTNAGTSGAA